MRGKAGLTMTVAGSHWGKKKALPQFGILAEPAVAMLELFA